MRRIRKGCTQDATLVFQSHLSSNSAGFQQAALRSSSVSIAVHFCLAAGRSILVLRKGTTRSTTCSTHAGLYSSSQVIAIVVKAGDSLGRNGSHVGLNTFSGNGLSRSGPHLLLETVDGWTFAEPYTW